MNISRNGAIGLSDLKYVEAKSGYDVKPGDVLFNNANSPELIGKSTVCSVEMPLAYSNHMTRIRTNESVEPSFLAHQLHWLWMTGYFRHRCTNHVNQASISSGPLADSVGVAVPPIGEQRHIVAEIEKQFTRLDEGLLQLSTAEARTRRLPSVIIRKAFERNLPLKPLNELAVIRGGLTMHADRRDIALF